jgi:hypothetical protein
METCRGFSGKWYFKMEKNKKQKILKTVSYNEDERKVSNEI